MGNAKNNVFSKGFRMDYKIPKTPHPPRLKKKKAHPGRSGPPIEGAPRGGKKGKIRGPAPEGNGALAAGARRWRGLRQSGVRHPKLVPDSSQSGDADGAPNPLADAVGAWGPWLRPHQRSPRGVYPPISCPGGTPGKRPPPTQRWRCGVVWVARRRGAPSPFGSTLETPPPPSPGRLHHVFSAPPFSAARGAKGCRTVFRRHSVTQL